jgi:hypothetical protein
MTEETTTAIDNKKYSVDNIEPLGWEGAVLFVYVLSRARRLYATLIQPRLEGSRIASYERHTGLEHIVV